MEVPSFLRSMMAAQAALEAKKTPAVDAAKTGGEAGTSDRGQEGSGRLLKGTDQVVGPSAEVGIDRSSSPSRTRRKSQAVKRGVGSAGAKGGDAQKKRKTAVPSPPPSDHDGSERDEGARGEVADDSDAIPPIWNDGFRLDEGDYAPLDRFLHRETDLKFLSSSPNVDLLSMLALQTTRSLSAIRRLQSAVPAAERGALEAQSVRKWRCSKLKKEVAAEKGKVATLEKDNALMLSQMKEGALEAERVLRDRDELRKSLEQVTARAREAEDQLEAVRAQAASVEAEKERLALVEAEKEELASQVAALEGEKEQLQGEYVELGQRMFNNARDQLALLNPGMNTEGLSPSHYVQGDQILRYDQEAKQVYVIYHLPTEQTAGRRGV